jgi:fructose-1,6-bisphosphatase I
MYPSNPSYPDGKIRLMYECNALAFVVEQAGGKASTGFERVMEIVPQELHQRCTLFIGSKAMVEKVESLHR